MHEIFISYSRADLYKVEKIKAIIEQSTSFKIKNSKYGR